MSIKEWQGDIIFLHQVVPGAAPGSYGVHVAKLAGLPPSVIARAGDILRTLEQNDHDGKLVALPAFDPAIATKPAAHPVVSELQALDIDALTPRAALEALYALKGKI